MEKYEQVTFEQLPNRAGHVERFMGIPETPDQAYVVLYQKPDGSWWNCHEAQTEEAALATIATQRRLGDEKPLKIVIATKAAATPEPVAEAVEEQNEASVGKQEEVVEVQPASSRLAEMAAKGRELYKNLPPQDAFDLKVQEVSRLAERLPNGYALRLCQDHVPLRGVIVRYDLDGQPHEETFDGFDAINRAKEHLQQMLQQSKFHAGDKVIVTDLINDDEVPGTIRWKAEGNYYAFSCTRPGCGTIHTAPEWNIRLAKPTDWGARDLFDPGWRERDASATQ